METRFETYAEVFWAVSFIAGWAVSMLTGVVFLQVRK